MAPRKQPSAVSRQDDNDICIDLAKLVQQPWAAQQQQTAAPAVQQPSKKLNCDLSPGTLTGGQDGNVFRNVSIAKPSMSTQTKQRIIRHQHQFPNGPLVPNLNICGPSPPKKTKNRITHHHQFHDGPRVPNLNICGPSPPKQTKQRKVYHHSPHDAQRISKAARLPKEPARQSKHSKNWIGNSRDSPITVDDNPASRCISTPNKTSDPNPHYEVAQAFSFDRSIPPMDPNLIKTCPKPPPAALLFDQKASFPYRLAMARHMAYNGVSGPYELGEYLIDIHRATGLPVKIAHRDADEHGQPIWRHLITGDRIQPQDESNVSGKPVALSTGALIRMEDANSTVIAPEWIFSRPRE
ncbi:hypothetical protein ACHAPI_003098 [Fusarium lateritium]